jgi:hypothetical protein
MRLITNQAHREDIAERESYEVGALADQQLEAIRKVSVV